MNIENSNITVVQVMLAYTCNLSCNYCYQDFETSVGVKKMTIQTFQSILDMFQSKKIDLNLYWGEPLLNKEIIDYMISDNFVLPDNIKIISINTNGTLIDDRFLKFCQKFSSKIKVEISIDGNQSTHDFYRKDFLWNTSYNKIISNLSIFEDLSFFSVNFCISPYAVSSLFSSFYSLYKIWFRKVKCIFLFEMDWRQEDFKKLISELIKVKFFRWKMDINIFYPLSPSSSECEDDFKNNFTFLPSWEIIPCPVWISKYSSQVPKTPPLLLSDTSQRIKYINEQIFSNIELIHIMKQWPICEFLPWFLFRKNKGVINKIMKELYC